MSYFNLVSILSDIHRNLHELEIEYDQLELELQNINSQIVKLGCYYKSLDAYLCRKYVFNKINKNMPFLKIMLLFMQHYPHNMCMKIDMEEID